MYYNYNDNNNRTQNDMIVDLRNHILGTQELLVFYRTHVYTPQTLQKHPDTADREASTVHGRHIPIGLDAMADADDEAMYVGELLRFSITSGLIPDPGCLAAPEDRTTPRLTLSAFWWGKGNNRRCLGLAGRDRALEDAIVACRVLAAHAEEIVEYMEEFSNWFSGWKAIRSTGLKILRRASSRREDTREEVCLTVEQASLYSGRSVETITTWMKQGLLETTSEEVMRHRMVTETSLISAMSTKKIAMRNNLNKNISRNLGKAS